MTPAAAIFLSGPIGSGKTTLGRMLAQALGAVFVDGDHHSDQHKPWFASSLSTARSIVRTVREETINGSDVVVAYPLRCLEWIFYRRRLAEWDTRTIFVSLGASYDAIASPNRGRAFSSDELTRIKEMIAQGYGARSFSDVFLRTDIGTPDSSLRVLIDELADLKPTLRSMPAFL